MENNSLERTVALLRKSYAGRLTTEEQAEVDRLLADKDIRRLYKEVEDDEYLLGEFRRYDLWQPVRGYQEFWKKKRRMGIRGMAVRLSVAASVMLVLGSVLWLGLQKEQDSSPRVVEVEVEPGSSRAFLQLSSGERVDLKGEKSLDLHDTDGKIRIDSGKVVYAALRGSANPLKNAYNILSVPRGGEYQLCLSDGTMVHLNAGSELRYPVAFTGAERKVFLKGEAWFEVAKEIARPFYVETGEVKIRVYGTSFNVNTHGIHTIETVLVSGEIGISHKKDMQEWRMHPGQLACYDRSRGEMILKEVDVSEYIAWKDGEFCFNDDTLEDILEELGRWYDVAAFFHSPAKKTIQFSGHLKRYEDIRKILNAITESTGIVFEINGRTVVVK